MVNWWFGVVWGGLGCFHGPLSDSMSANMSFMCRENNNVQE